jgi:hypothetical protein
MNFEATYIESQTGLKKGGLILRGNTRNTRQPVHMMLLCDTSGSMEEQGKLESVKKSVNLLLSLLSPDDRISLVTFADASKIVLTKATPSNEDRQALHYRVETLRPDGSTNLSAGLLDVRNLVEGADSGRKQGVIVLTDGHANVGVVKEDAILAIISQIQSEHNGLTFTTVAYGVDHNAEMLTQIAKAGGGAYNVVKNLEDVATVFGDILGGLVSVSAQGVEVQLPPGAVANTSYRKETDPAGVTTVYVGDIYADAEIVLLFQNDPTQGPLRIKGTDMSNLNRINEVVEPTPHVLGQPAPLAIHIAQVRQRAAYLIQLATKSFTNTVKAQIEALIQEIEIDEIIHAHPLKPMLLEDLREAIKVVNQQGSAHPNQTIELLQHSAFLSMTRGLRSNTRPVPQAAATRSNSPLQRSPNAFLSPFASRTQAEYATVMRTASQQPYEDPDENSQH